MAKNKLTCIIIFILVAAIITLILAGFELKRVNGKLERITSAYTLYLRETERRVVRLEGITAEERRISEQLKSINRQLGLEHQQDRQRIAAADRYNDEARAIIKRLISQDGL